MSIDQIPPVSQQQASVYLPYIHNSKRSELPYAISLYQKGILEGTRKIEAGESIPFVATWNVATLPLDLTRCRVQFDSNAESNYEVMMSSFEFISYLIEIRETHKRHRLTDFSQAFYRKLLHKED
jgi:hypothetical protein